MLRILSLLAIGVTLTSAAHAQPTPPKPLSVAILLYDGFTQLDATGPYEVLVRVPGLRVHFVAKTKKPVMADTRLVSLTPTDTFASLPHPDVLLVPGGVLGTRAAINDPATVAWVRTAHQTSRFTTSVCAGALILGAAGVLNGLDATTHWAVRDQLKTFGANFKAERYVQRGKVITAAGVSAGLDMALHLADQLAGRTVAEAVQLFIEYAPQPPLNAGSLATASPEAQRLAGDFLRESLQSGQ